MAFSFLFLHHNHIICINSIQIVLVQLIKISQSWSAFRNVAANFIQSIEFFTFLWIWEPLLLTLEDFYRTNKIGCTHFEIIIILFSSFVVFPSILCLLIILLGYLNLLIFILGVVFLFCDDRLIIIFLFFILAVVVIFVDLLSRTIIFLILLLFGNFLHLLLWQLRSIENINIFLKLINNELRILKIKLSHVNTFFPISFLSLLHQCIKLILCFIALHWFYEVQVWPQCC